MIQRLKDNLQVILVIGAVIGMTVSSMAYFAKANDLQLVEQRLDQKIQADQVYYMQRRLWQLYDYYKTQNCEAMPQPGKDECRAIKTELAKFTGRG